MVMELEVMTAKTREASRRGEWRFTTLFLRVHCFGIFSLSMIALFYHRSQSTPPRESPTTTDGSTPNNQKPSNRRKIASHQQEVSTRRPSIFLSACVGSLEGIKPVFKEEKLRNKKMIAAVALTLLSQLFHGAVVDAFVIPPPPPSSSSGIFHAAVRSSAFRLLASATPELQRVPADMEGVPIPFVDLRGNSFIECYADSVAIVDGVEYTIGVPCDYSVAICYFDENEALVPVELDDKLMDDVFPIAEGIVAEEFGEELSLQRTPQTLTLVGELEEDDEDDEMDFEEDDDLSIDDDDTKDEEEVEVLLSFEHRGKDFNLVRLLDPILLVGKVDPSMPDNRVLLTEEESDKIMPLLENMFLEYHNDPDDLLP